MGTIPEGLRLRARSRAFLETAKSHGLTAAFQALLLGPDHFRALELLGKVEPMLLVPQDARARSEIERISVRPGDIYAHLPTLYKLTVDGRRRRILELGTRSGDSTLALLLGAKETGGHVTSVDIEPCPEAQARVAASGLTPYWTFLLSDDLVLPWTEPVEHLFIDTSHAYDHTLAELRKYEPLVVPGGVITMHDATSNPDVWRAVEDHFRGRADVRVFRYLHNNGLALIEKHG